MSALNVFCDERSRQLVSAQAYCTSVGCVENLRLRYEAEGKMFYKYYKQRGVPKDVSRSLVDCPDCQHALVWIPQFKIQHQELDFDLH